MMNSKEATGSADGGRATNTGVTGMKSFLHENAKPSHTHDQTNTERKIHTVLGEEETYISKKTKTCTSYDHDADEFATECKRDKFDVNLTNKSENRAEIGMISENDESHTNKVPIQGTDMSYDLSGIKSEMTPSVHVMRPSSAKNTLEAQTNETYEEIVKRIEQFLISEGLITNGPVNWQAVANKTTHEEIEGLAADKLEEVFLEKICQIYHCPTDIAIIRFKQGKYEQIMNMWKEETLEVENRSRRVKKMMDDYNLAPKAKNAKKLKKKQRPSTSTAGMSSGQEISKEEERDKALTKRVHKKNTTVKDFTETESNRFQEKEGQSDMTPTKGGMCPRYRSLVAEKSGNSALGEISEDTPILPEPVSGTKALVSHKEQNPSIKKNINTITQTGQVSIKLCSDRLAQWSKSCTNTTNKCIDVIDLTADDDLPVTESVTETPSVTKNTTTPSKAVDTTLVPNTLSQTYERQIQASGSGPKPAIANPVKIKVEPNESSAGSPSYVAPQSETVKEPQVGVATIFVLP